MDLTEETYETAHGGYDPVYANEDADRVLPVDVLREMEKEGKIGKLYINFTQQLVTEQPLLQQKHLLRNFLEDES